jgi:hypothetical protein
MNVAHTLRGCCVDYVVCTITESFHRPLIFFVLLASFQFIYFFYLYAFSRLLFFFYWDPIHLSISGLLPHIQIKTYTFSTVSFTSLLLIHSSCFHEFSSCSSATFSVFFTHLLILTYLYFFLHIFSFVYSFLFFLLKFPPYSNVFLILTHIFSYSCRTYSVLIFFALCIWNSSSLIYSTSFNLCSKFGSFKSFYPF